MRENDLFSDFEKEDDLLGGIENERENKSVNNVPLKDLNAPVKKNVVKPEAGKKVDEKESLFDAEKVGEDEIEKFFEAEEKKKTNPKPAPKVSPKAAPKKEKKTEEDEFADIKNNKEYNDKQKSELISLRRGYSSCNVKDDVTRGQADKTRSMKHLIREMDANLKKSSNEFKNMKNDLDALDDFMEDIKGRTRLSAAEIDTYDKLALKAYNSTTAYLARKTTDRVVKPEDKDPAKEYMRVDGKDIEPKNDYERNRIETVEQIRNKITVMRNQMLDELMKKKTDEMAKACNAQLEVNEGKRVDIVEKISSNPAKAADYRGQFENSVVESIYFSNRMESLRAANELQVKKDESFAKACVRLDKSLVMKAGEKDEIADNDLTQEIVDHGMNSAKHGYILSGVDIADIVKKGELKEAKNIINQNIMEQNKRPVGEIKNNNERKLEMTNNNFSL